MQSWCLLVSLWLVVSGAGEWWAGHSRRAAGVSACVPLPLWRRASLSDLRCLPVVTVADILLAGVLGLVAHRGVIRALFCLRCASCQRLSVAETEYVARQLGQWPVHLVFSALHRQELDEVQRGAVEL